MRWSVAADKLLGSALGETSTAHSTSDGSASVCGFVLSWDTSTC